MIFRSCSGRSIAIKIKALKHIFALHRLWDMGPLGYGDGSLPRSGCVHSVSSSLCLGPVFWARVLGEMRAASECCARSKRACVALCPSLCQGGLGLEVDFPPAQTCSGRPAFNAGFRDQARAVARYSLAVLTPYDHVIVPPEGCAAMFHVFYPALLAEAPEFEGRAELETSNRP